MQIKYSPPTSFLSFPIADCVEILEERLGLSPTSNGNLSESSSTVNRTSFSDQTRGKKNPLGFIVDFFRPKKAKSSSSPIEVCEEGPGSDQGPDRRVRVRTADRNCNHRTRLGAAAATAEDGGRLSTPRRQKESEVLKSIEKLHVSRTDNPVLQGRTPARQQRPTVLPVLPAAPPAGPTTSTAEAENGCPDEATVDHTMLIRSPPPIIKHEQWTQEDLGTHSSAFITF